MSQKHKPRVDFYKLDTENRTRVNRFCCQLAEKVVKMGNAVFVKTRDAAETRYMDELMWTFSDSSFLAHAIQGDAEDSSAPVIIGHHAASANAYLLINLSDERPENALHFERIAEVIDAEPHTLHQGRVRYSAYKQDAYPLHYHEITT